MAFLGAPLRWPDAVSPNGQASLFDPVADAVRPYAPRVLGSLPSPVLASFTLSLGLLVAALAFSATLNARRASLVPAKAVQAPRRKTGRPLTTLLVGPEQSGKSAIYSALVFGAVPDTQTSQHENESSVSLPTTATGQESSSTALRLVDLPGHPRIRSRVNDYLPIADKIVFCIDLSSAIRGGATKNETLIEAVDQFHATLTALARNRLSRAASKASLPPSLLVLFTRGDLSPLLAASPHDAKRQAQAMLRARTAFEAELGRRRAGMGLGRGAAHQSKAKVASMGKVIGGGSSSTGWSGMLWSLLGMGSNSSESRRGDDGADDEAEEELDGLDYVDWAWAQRQTAAPSTAQGESASASGFSLDRLDADVVMGGKATFAVASLGKDRGWTPPTPEEGESAFLGLQTLRSWLSDVDA
ncbi:unnamed protein product [Parajaminaea phylloscopi]